MCAPVFLPEKSHGQRSLVGYSPWGCKESDMAEWLNTQRGESQINRKYPTTKWLQWYKCSLVCGSSYVHKGLFKYINMVLSLLPAPSPHSLPVSLLYPQWPRWVNPSEMYGDTPHPQLLHVYCENKTNFSIKGYFQVFFFTRQAVRIFSCFVAMVSGVEAVFLVREENLENEC